MDWRPQPTLAPATLPHTSQDCWLTSGWSCPCGSCFTFTAHIETTALCCGWLSSQTPGETQHSSMNCPACTLPQTASFRGGGAKGLHAIIPSTGTHTCRSQAAEDAVPLGFCFCLRGSYSLATD